MIPFSTGRVIIGPRHEGVLGCVSRGTAVRPDLGMILQALRFARGFGYVAGRPGPVNSGAGAVNRRLGEGHAPADDAIAA